MSEPTRYRAVVTETLDANRRILGGDPYPPGARTLRNGRWPTCRSVAAAVRALHRVQWHSPLGGQWMGHVLTTDGVYVEGPFAL